MDTALAALPLAEMADRLREPSFRGRPLRAAEPARPKASERPATCCCSTDLMSAADRVNLEQSTVLLIGTTIRRRWT